MPDFPHDLLLDRPVTRDLLPTAADVADFDRDGWWVSPVILPQEELDLASAAVDRYHRGERDAPLPPEHPTVVGRPITPKPPYDWRPDSGTGLRENDLVIQQSAGLARLAGHPMIAASAARLLRTSQVRLYTSTLLVKPPNLEGDRGKIGWHADQAYLRNCTAERMITAWVALHDCPAEMGPIAMAPGSHRWPDDGAIRRLRFKRTFRSGEGERLLADIAGSGFALEHRPVEVKRGQVSFHDHRVFHGSDLNRTDGFRQTIILELQPRENSYFPRDDDTGPLYVHQNDRRCARLDDDRPDYSDPLLCPVLWDDSWLGR